MQRSRAFLLAPALIVALAGTLVLPVAAPSPAPFTPQQTAPYYPGPGEDWERRSPEQLGFDRPLLEAAIAFAQANETAESRDLAMTHRMRFEAYGEPLGPFTPRGDPTGMVVRHGYIAAEWGDPRRVDMTFSVTKSFLSTTVGLAYDRGLIRDVGDRVRDYVPTEEFASAHNGLITWDHLLRQTSDWEGTLWGKPDWADRPPRDQTLAQYRDRKRTPPGTFHKYNDVRVNLLAFAALHVWRRPLPQVLREYVMDPIGASNTWRWYGYDNSWLNIDGTMLQSVSGGGHWGGGLWISARDQARFGLLTLRRGKWRDRQILSEAWVRMALTPTPVEIGYGFMNWYLNTRRELLPSAPETSFCHVGAGANMICAVPDQDLVVVVRWTQPRAVDGLVQRLLIAIKDGADGQP